MPNFTQSVIQPWFDFKPIYDLAFTELARDGAIFVEVGAFLGESTFYMAEKIKKSGKKVKFYVIDVWDADFLTSAEERNLIQGKYFFTTFIENLLPLMEFIYPIRLPSLVAANIFGNGVVDFVFIDASHQYEDVKADIQAWMPKIKKSISEEGDKKSNLSPHAILAGHDIDFIGVRKAVSEIFGNNFQVKHRSWMVRR